MSSRRNSSCACGSGKKFKNCCGSRAKKPHPPFPSPEILAAHRAHIESLKEQQSRLGQTRPILHADHNGHKIVAVGDQIVIQKNCKTFIDFLFVYVRELLGLQWGQAELAKPPAKRHEIANWYVHVCKLQQRQTVGADGIYAMEPDGITNAYFLLAYDLYL